MFCLAFIIIIFYLNIFFDTFDKTMSMCDYTKDFKAKTGKIMEI